MLRFSHAVRKSVVGVVCLCVLSSATMSVVPQARAAVAEPTTESIGSFLRGAGCGWAVGAAVMSGGLFAPEAIVICAVALILTAED
jgi:hypothetical protein